MIAGGSHDTVYFPSGLALDEDLLGGEEISSMEVSMKQLVGLQ